LIKAKIGLGLQVFTTKGVQIVPQGAPLTLRTHSKTTNKVSCQAWEQKEIGAIQASSRPEQEEQLARGKARSPNPNRTKRPRTTPLHTPFLSAFMP
jgi:hypothetical protein